MAERPEKEKTCDQKNRYQEHSKLSQLIGIKDLKQVDMVIEDRTRASLVDIQDAEKQQDKYKVECNTDGDGSRKG